MKYVHDPSTGLNILQKAGVLCMYEGIEPFVPVGHLQKIAETVKVRKFKDVHNANLEWLFANGFRGHSGYETLSNWLALLTDAFTRARVEVFTKSLDGEACCMQYFLAVAEEWPVVAGLAHMKARTAVISTGQASLDDSVRSLILADTGKVREALGSHFLICTKYKTAQAGALEIVTNVTIGFPSVSNSPKDSYGELSGKVRKVIPAYGELQMHAC